jgi:hypothetical protein
VKNTPLAVLFSTSPEREPDLGIGIDKSRPVTKACRRVIACQTRPANLAMMDDTLYIGHMALKRMDNIGIVVEDLGGTIDFYRELGLELEGRTKVEGEWAGRVTGLGDQRVEIAMMRTPDGHGRLELSRFLTPPAVADHRNAP